MSQPLPTPDEVLHKAMDLLNLIYRAAGDAGDELRSDTRESWTSKQAAQKQATFTVLGEIKERINALKNSLEDPY